MLPLKFFINRVSAINVERKCCSSKCSVKEIEKSVGLAMKKFNKENKNLFGKLLETRAEKRQNAKIKNLTRTNVPNETLKTDTYATELQWSLRLLSGKMRNVQRQRNPHFQKIIRTTRSGIEKSVSTCSSYNSNVSLDQKIEDVEAMIPKIEPYKNVPSINDLAEYGKASPMVHLPDNVLKNIPSFPLFNNGITSELGLSDYKSKNSNWKKEYYTYPSVSKILSATMSEKSRAALRRWEQRMIAELGQEGFMQFHAGQLSQGEEFHAAIHDYLSGVPEGKLSLSSEGAEGCWHSVRHSVLNSVGSACLLEAPLVHPLLRYQGITDCVATYKGAPMLIEWKKSDKRKSSLELTYDAPLQVCAYIGALSFDPRHTKLKVEGGLVVVAYSDGSPADLFALSTADCSRHWQQWLARLQQYWLRNTEVVSDLAAAAAE